MLRKLPNGLKLYYTFRMAEVGKRKTFGILIDWPDTNSNYQKVILDGIRQYAEEHDINLMVLAVGRLNSPFKWENPKEFLYKLTRNRNFFDGFIVLSLAICNYSGIEALEEKLGAVLDNSPVVSISGQLRNNPVINIDNTVGLQELITHLIKDHGYKNPIFVSGPKQNPEAMIRLQVFRDVMAELGLSVDESSIYYGNFISESGQWAVDEILDKRSLVPDVFICANDNMAIGVLQKLWERKIHVPDDIAVTGFDNLKISRVLDLPFTTVNQPFFQEGFMAAETLDKMINGKPVQQKITLPTEVVFRKTCGCQIDGNIKPSIDSREKSSFIRWEQRICRTLEQPGSSNSAEELVRIWNDILIDAVHREIKQLDMTKLLHNTLEMVKEHFQEDGQNALDIQNKLNRMFNDIFVEGELLNRLNETDTISNTLNAIDTFGNDAMISSNFEKELGKLNYILNNADIPTCYLTKFTHKEFEYDGVSRLIYARISGNEQNIDAEKALFTISQIIPDQYLPSQRFNLVAQGLYEADEHFGMLIMSLGAKGFDTYEMLRRRMSELINSLENQQNLKALNERLRTEIQMRVETERKLKEALETVQNLSLTDELTGLYNRRGFLTLATQQMRNCIRDRIPFTVFYIDLDGLKQINDIHGHKEGDFAICKTAEILHSCLREIDVLARLGGDEFTVFASKADSLSINTIQARLEKKIENCNAEMNKPFNLSMSVGYYTCENYQSLPHFELEEIMESADQMLYRVKKQKKNHRIE